jgi:hypothetical protein
MNYLIKSIVLFLIGLSFIYASPYPIETLEVTGVMRCAPAVNSANDFYDMYGCLSNSGVLSIKKFFDKYKRNKNDRIIKIRYDSSQNLLHIYYGTGPGLPYPEESIE